MEYLVQIRDLSKRYYVNDDELCVINNLNFNVKQGEVVSVLGYTGCGKTTLLRMMCALEKADSGEILFQGNTLKRPCKDIIMVFQNLDQVFPWKTAKENLSYVIRKVRHIKDKAEIERIAIEILKEVGLDGYADFYPGQMSGGMRQRCAVARALAIRPKLLLMDEPFSALDEITRRHLQILCRGLFKQHGMTVVFVTHSIEEAITLSDRILIMQTGEGRIVSQIENAAKCEESDDIRLEMRTKIIKLLNK